MRWMRYFIEPHPETTQAVLDERRAPQIARSSRHTDTDGTPAPSLGDAAFDHATREGEASRIAWRDHVPSASHLSIVRAEDHRDAERAFRGVRILRRWHRRRIDPVFLGAPTDPANSNTC